MKYYLRNVYFGRVLLAIGFDTVCFLSAAAITWHVLEPSFPGNLYAGAAIGGALLSFVALFYCDAYSPATIGDSGRTTLSIINSMGLAFGAALVFYYAASVPEGVVPAMAETAGYYFPMLFFGRAIFRGLWNFQRLKSRVLIIGASDLGLEIADCLSRQRNAGIELVGFLSDDPGYHFPGATFESFPVLGQVHHLEKILDATHIDYVVVASKERDEHFPVDALQAAKMGGVRVESGVSFYEHVSGKIYLRDLRPSYLIFNEGFRMGRVASGIKRTIDVVGSGLALICAAPVIGAFAIAIRLESAGPAFFSQVRVGCDNKPFLMHKLRSMRSDAEAETGAVFTSQGDARITRIGQFIRRTRIDELPQLWNILSGEMSIVGPRAERPEFAQALSERYDYYRVRSSVKPGLTGWAQTRFGYVSDLDAYEEKLAHDLFYLKYRSPAMDAFIMWQTIKTVLLFRGM